jgi:hypothetical protein
MEREDGELELSCRPERSLRQGGARRTLRDELEAEGQLPLEDLDLAPLLLEREQVLAAAAAAGVRRRVHLGLPRRTCRLDRPPNAAPWERQRPREREREREGGRGEDRERGIGVGASRRRRIFPRLFSHGRRGGSAAD